MKSEPKARLDRECVLAAAAELVNRNGLDQLTMGELAAILGIRTPSLYTHVTGRNELFRLLAMRGLFELDERIARAALGKSTDDATRAFANAERQFAHENPGVYMATQAKPPADDTEWNTVRDRLLDTMFAALAGYGVDGEEAIHAVRTLRSLAHGYAVMEMSDAFRSPVSTEASFEWAISTFIAGLKRGR